MKLYELHRGECFTLKETPTQPPDSINIESDQDKLFTLSNIDGMYSYVTDNDNNVYHFAAWTEVTPINELSVSHPTTL